MESFDIVAVCGNKVECCFDIVAGVNGALVSLRCVCAARSIKVRKTDRRTPDRYITLTARRGQRNK